MELGFETCGNATIIAYDGGVPVLATDPWIEGAQYFGSWTLPFLFTPEQRESFSKVSYIWVSHGHPDHLNLDSLELFRDKTILIPKHRGDRISTDLKRMGFRVQDVPTGEWVQLSPRVRIVSYGDWNQDAAVLVALGDQCGVLNLNDGEALGTQAQLQQQFARFRKKFVLSLINYGDADMMNFFTESGERIAPLAAQPGLLGHAYNRLLKDWNGTHTAPFSCNHMYARTDSQWAAQYETPAAAHGKGFNPKLGQLVPGYFSYDVLRDSITLTPAEPVARRFRPPEDFGDNWAEPLVGGEAAELGTYFKRFEHLRDTLQFLNFRVGGRDNIIDLAGPKGHGVTFEAPRGSLLFAVRNEIFDDLLIGNFMKTTLHGVVSLYPDFTPYVAKYGDNGRAFTRAQIREYFASYSGTAGLKGWIDRISLEGGQRVRNVLMANRDIYLLARRVYRFVKS